MIATCTAHVILSLMLTDAFVSLGNSLRKSLGLFISVYAHQSGLAIGTPQILCNK